ncbi:acyl-CoA thioesterase [Natrarchaeobaculum sulfurireducens]|nr:thioesterase family protein [Natrarchaeobaculum sulfurireducens]AXR79060.1 Acyl-CoA thioesterase FadM [Natrarchaeobaculum sulfurireducens]
MADTDPDADLDPAFQTVFENRVRFAETDLQGVVFYGEYFTYQDEAVTAFFREIGYSYDRMVEAGWQVHVVSASLDYRDGAEFDDRLRNRIRVSDVGTSSLTFEHRIEREDGSLVAEGTVTHVAVDLETEAPTPLPDDFLEAIATYQGGLPE